MKRPPAKDIEKMKDDLRNYHEGNVAGVRMKIETTPGRGRGPDTFRLFVNDKLVNTQQWTPNREHTHPFNYALIEAYFEQAYMQMHDPIENPAPEHHLPGFTFAADNTAYPDAGAAMAAAVALAMKSGESTFTALQGGMVVDRWRVQVERASVPGVERGPVRGGLGTTQRNPREQVPRHKHDWSSDFPMGGTATHYTKAGKPVVLYAMRCRKCGKVSYQDSRGRMRARPGG